MNTRTYTEGHEQLTGHPQMYRITSLPVRWTSEQDGAPVPSRLQGVIATWAATETAKTHKPQKQQMDFDPPKGVICHVRKCQMPRRHHVQSALLLLQILPGPRGAASRSCSLLCQLPLLLCVLSDQHHSLHRGCVGPHGPWSMKMWRL